MMTLAEVAAWTGGQSHGEARLHGVSTDTRCLEPGSLFVALRGPRFDGHCFLSEARKAGAAAALVERAEGEAELPVVTVADTHQALLDLAAAWRDRQATRIVAITGSCGKTTVKDLTAAVLQAAAGEEVLATPGNWNNTVGLPLTLLRLREHHAFAAVEVGINRVGEMALLAETVRPSVAVITNAAVAHLEGLGSVEAVAAEKGQLLEGLDRDGVAVINADSPFAEAWANAAPGPVLRYGLEAPAELTGRWLPSQEGGWLRIRTGSEEVEVYLPLPGAHNASNALAAVASALALGLPLGPAARGLEAAAPPEGRLQVRSSPFGWTVLDDTYNANPASLEAALLVLTGSGERNWLILGDMGELGAEGRQWHRHAGKRARDLGVTHLLTVGELAAAAAPGFGAGARTLEDWTEAAEVLDREASPGDRILVKGSRSMRLERLVAHLTGEER